LIFILISTDKNVSSVKVHRFLMVCNRSGEWMDWGARGIRNRTDSKRHHRIFRHGGFWKPCL